MRSFFYLSLAGLLLMSCEESSTVDLPPPSGDSLSITEAFPILSFDRPVDLQSAGGDKLYVVEQPGIIRIVDNGPTADEKPIFLDIQDRVDDRDNEEGLLGLVFHPDFNSNGYFFVNYTTNQSTTRISRYQADPANPEIALTSSETIIIEFDQPFGNHNGGQICFGPDGYLYVAVGDGGSGGDPQNNGQDRSTLLGSVLRIDTDRVEGNKNYAIPADNPWVNNTDNYREEIFAYGLRNPWRMSFDPKSGLLWAADVGQGDYEEIDIIQKGENYGWNILEGPDCFRNSGCDPAQFKEPYFYYQHDNGNLSITGGYVYRGSIVSLEGYYVYADYESGRIWALPVEGTNPQEVLLFDTNHSISTFGLDNQGELYFCDLGGKIFKISS